MPETFRRAVRYARLRLKLIQYSATGMKAFLGAARVTALEPPTDKVTYIHQLLDKYATKVIPTSVGANAREQGDRSAGHHE